MPGQNVLQHGGVEVKHYYGSIKGDHGPGHVHVFDSVGNETKIGVNLRPVRGEPALTREMALVVEANASYLRGVIKKANRWLQWDNM